MAYIAVAIGGAAIIGAGAQMMSANRAADAQSDAAAAANQTSMAQYNQTRADQTPWRDAGGRALSNMENPDFQKKFSMSDYQQDPGYQFRLDEGNKAINASAAARGLNNSGATMKALTRYGQDYASGEYQSAYNRFNNDQTTRFNRLASVAGVGQTANNQVAAAGQNMSNQVGQNMMAAGNAQSAAQMAQGNAISGAIGNGTNAWMNYQMMNKFAPQQQSTYTSGISGGSAAMNPSAGGTGYLGSSTNFNY